MSRHARPPMVAVGCLPGAGTVGVCDRCCAPLPARARRWCSRECGYEAAADHVWSVARPTVLSRDNSRCVRCGGHPKDGEVPAVPPDRREFRTHTAWSAACDRWSARLSAKALHVDHIVPLGGAPRGGWSCAHHRDNLQTLCAGCHRFKTVEDRRVLAVAG